VQQSRETIANREGEMTIQFNVNGKPASTDAPPQTPLLWVIREGLKLTGTKFGCGTGLCGACMVHIDGKRAFSCQTQVSEVAGKSVTTIEGLSPDSSHPLQKAWLAEGVPQCGYCQSGQIMNAAALLKDKAQPTRAEIIDHMSTNICRCGTYQRIVRAVERASREA
jgi:isoquinoline 1-oxidoreductase alpha subunit